MFRFLGCFDTIVKVGLFEGEPVGGGEGEEREMVGG
jgi:hypothetical protein